MTGIHENWNKESSSKKRLAIILIIFSNPWCQFIVFSLVIERFCMTSNHALGFNSSNKFCFNFKWIIQWIFRFNTPIHCLWIEIQTVSTSKFGFLYFFLLPFPWIKLWQHCPVQTLQNMSESFTFILIKLYLCDGLFLRVTNGVSSNIQSFTTLLCMDEFLYWHRFFPWIQWKGSLVHGKVAEDKLQPEIQYKKCNRMFIHLQHYMAIIQSYCKNWWRFLAPFYIANDLPQNCVFAYLAMSSAKIIGCLCGKPGNDFMDYYQAQVKKIVLWTNLIIISILGEKRCKNHFSSFCTISSPELYNFVGIHLIGAIIFD